MQGALDDACATGWQSLESGTVLPDPTSTGTASRQAYGPWGHFVAASNPHGPTVAATIQAKSRRILQLRTFNAR